MFIPGRNSGYNPWNLSRKGVSEHWGRILMKPLSLLVGYANKQPLLVSDPVLNMAE